MELAGYRENIEMLQDLFPGRVTINLSECAQILGVNIKTVYESTKPYRKNPIPTQLVGGRKRVVPLVGLARWMCKRTEVK